MFPFSVTGSISLDEGRVDDAVAVAIALEQKLAPAPWQAERQDNRLHFEGGVYSESASAWRTLLNVVGICWLEVCSEPGLTLRYKANTGEMAWLTFGLVVGLGLLIEALVRMPVVAVAVALPVGAAIVTASYFYEARRLRDFLSNLVAECCL